MEGGREEGRMRGKEERRKDGESKKGRMGRSEDRWKEGKKEGLKRVRKEG